MRKVIIELVEFHVLDNDQLREHPQTLAETHSADLEPSKQFFDEMVEFVPFANEAVKLQLLLLCYCTKKISMVPFQMLQLQCAYTCVSWFQIALEKGHSARWHL